MANGTLAKRCIWCGHTERLHSVIFGECEGVAFNPDGTFAGTQCLCKEFAAAPPEPSPTLLTRITAPFRIAWWWTLSKVWARVEGWQRR